MWRRIRSSGRTRKFTQPPKPDGTPVYLPAFAGTIYLLRADGAQSNPQGFSFQPETDYRTVWIDKVIGDAIFPRYTEDGLGCCNSIPGIYRHDLECFSGHSGTDQLYVNTHLKNGWTVRSPPTVISPYNFGGGGGAVPVSYQIGTNSPAVGVTWWVNAGPFNWCTSGFSYSVALPIQGPYGLSDGIAVP
jgi:hypothetical protein